MDKQQWLQVKENGTYTPSSIEEEGFIHCATKEQTQDVANLFFKGQTGLTLLCIDSSKVNSEIVYEDLYETGKLFPHIYGPLNTEAVYKEVSYESSRDGTFEMPVL